MKPIAPFEGRALRKYRAYGYHFVPPKYLGIVVARAIAFGDVSYAYKLAAGRRSWRVCEARAILGAIAAARVWWSAQEINAGAFGL